MTVIFCPRKLVYKPYSVILKLITCRIPVKFEQYARHIKKNTLLEIPTSSSEASAVTKRKLDFII